MIGTTIEHPAYKCSTIQQALQIKVTDFLYKICDRFSQQIFTIDFHDRFPLFKSQLSLLFLLYLSLYCLTNMGITKILLNEWLFKFQKIIFHIGKQNNLNSIINISKLIIQVKITLFLNIVSDLHHQFLSLLQYTQISYRPSGSGWTLLYLLMINCVLLLTVASFSIATSISYQDLLFKQQLDPYIPECIIEHQKHNGVDEQFLRLDIRRFKQQMLPEPYDQTQVFGFGCEAQHPVTKEKLGMIYSAPGPTIRASSNKKLSILYSNNIKGKHLFQIDKSLIMDPYKQINANEIIGVPIVIHAHGMMVQSTSDGYPSAYVTRTGIKGPSYSTQRAVENNSFLYQYPLLERQATLWIHDHTIGITRLNIYAGLTAFLLIEPSQKTYLSEIPRKYDILLNIQDRTFKDNAELFYPNKWVAQYFGKALLVNGKVWPNMELKAHQYRLRLLNSCGSRILRLSFKSGGKTLRFVIVKTDSSYVDKPFQTKQILLHPGERVQVLIQMKAGQIQLVNNAKAPYPDGDPVDPQTSGKIMSFSINKSSPFKYLNISKNYIHQRQKLVSVNQVRYSLFIEESGHHNGDGKSLIDGHQMDEPYPDFINGYTYELNLINLTPDSHPFHIHLTQFELIERKSFDSKSYERDMLVLNGPLPWKNMTLLPLQKYINNATTYPSLHERALKDVLTVDPKQMITVRFRFLMPDGQEYPFDPSKGPGYVWHCHILEHEDNSMMVAFKMHNSFFSFKAKIFIIKCAGVTFGCLIIILLVYIYNRRKAASLQRERQGFGGRGRVQGHGLEGSNMNLEIETDEQKLEVNSNKPDLNRYDLPQSPPNLINSESYFISNFGQVDD